MSFSRLLLLPFALIYGAVIWLRNHLFDWGVLPSQSFSIPVISVGNLSAGGAGKTPQVEYLVNLLGDRYKIAVLSRGYKRKTRGFLEAGPGLTAQELGDEPMQMHRKFPHILVVVDAKRRRGIRQIMANHPEVNLVILDDAFQHRYVRPGLNLLLTGYYNPFFRNFLLPVGNLREARCRSARADALIITKTPDVFSPLDRWFFLKKLCKYKLKNIYFSYLKYGPLVPLTPTTPPTAPPKIKTMFLLTGIANSESLEEELKTRCQELLIHKYPDHHPFSRQDIRKLGKHFNKTISHSKIVVTTEKDAMRLQDKELQEILSDMPVYYLPITVNFHSGDKEKFQRMLETFLNRYSSV